MKIQSTVTGYLSSEQLLVFAMMWCDRLRDVIDYDDLLKLVFSTCPLLVVTGACVVQWLKLPALKSEITSSNPTLASKFQRNKMFLPRSLINIQYCGELPWPRGSIIGFRPPGLEFRTMCLECTRVHKGGLEPHAFHFIWFLILDNLVKNKKYGNFVSISSLTGDCAAEIF